MSAYTARVLRLILITTVAFAGPIACKSKSSDSSKGAEAQPEAGVAGPSQSMPVEVSISRDGTRIAVAPKVAFSERWSLAKVGKLPPAEQWKMITVVGRGGKQLFISEVAESHPGHSVRFYLDSKDRPSIGLFANSANPKAQPGVAEQPKVHLRDIQSVDVKTSSAPAMPPVSLSIERAGADPVSVDQAAFEPLEQVLPPDGEQTKGWQLDDVIAPHLGDAKSPALTLIAGDDEVAVPKGVVGSDEHVLFLKINRRGELRFRWFQVKPKVELKGELRGLSRVVVK